MKRFLGVLLGLGLAVAAELWGFDTPKAQAQPKPKTYLVCEVNAAAGSTTFVQTLKAPSASFTVSAAGPEAGVYFAVYELAAPVSCETLFMDSQQPGPYPAGINIEADTSHKPVLR